MYKLFLRYAANYTKLPRASKLFDSVKNGSVTQLAIQAETEGLQLPDPAAYGRYRTMNKHGAMAPKINRSDEIFIEIASRPNAKVLEIGCAYGLVCAEALKRGASDYVAVDLEIKHLKILAKRVAQEMPEAVDSLTLIPGAFPCENVLKHLEKNSFDAILTNTVLYFFNEKEVTEAFRQFAYLLKPGGKLIATSFTPHLVFLKKGIRERYESEVDNFLKAPNENKAKMALPGYVGTMGEVMVFTNEEFDGLGLTKGLPFFVFDQAIVKYLLDKEHFVAEIIEYFAMNEAWSLDKRNNDQILIVARKPIEDRIPQKN